MSECFVTIHTRQKHSMRWKINHTRQISIANVLWASRTYAYASYASRTHVRIDRNFSQCCNKINGRIAQKIWLIRRSNLYVLCTSLATHQSFRVLTRVGRDHHFFVTAMASESFLMFSAKLITNMTSKTQISKVSTACRWFENVHFLLFCWFFRSRGRISRNEAN